MDESEGIKSADDVNMLDSSSSVKTKPKKRSLVERELETSLTARITSPVTNGDTSCTSRYGRARRRKDTTDFTDSDKALSQWNSPSSEKTPVKLPSPIVYKMNASNSPIKTEPKETPKKVITTDSSLDSQIENIYHENISLSRFGSEEKPKKSPGVKFPKVYVRTDLIQKREKEETVALIKNIFSPTHSPYKAANSHLSNVLERSAEKYNINAASKSHNGYLTPSVVKTLDFDSNKKKKKENRDGKAVLSKSDLFDVEAKCQYQVGDLVWARMGTYPFWPSIVTREPDSGMFVKKKLFGRSERDLIHVTFFGDNGRRSWILDTMLRKFLGLLEFQSAREWFSPSAKKRDPRLYAAFFISEKKLPQWNVSVEEAEALLREPKRLRIDILNDMLAKPRFKSTPKQQKSNKITRTASDVSLSESLYDTLFSEDDGKSEDPDRSRNKLRTSLDVSEVVTACLDNMAAKTGITKIQRQSHMDRWLQKAKSKTPEKSQTKVTPLPREKEVKVISSKKKKFSPAPVLKQKPYSFRKHVNESHNLRSHHNEHDYSSNLNNSAQNDSAVVEGSGIGFIAKVESLHGKETAENEGIKFTSNDIDTTDHDLSKVIEKDTTEANSTENAELGPIISADDTIDEIQVNICTVEENAELEKNLNTEKALEVVEPNLDKHMKIDSKTTKPAEDGAHEATEAMQVDLEYQVDTMKEIDLKKSENADSEKEISENVPKDSQKSCDVGSSEKQIDSKEHSLSETHLENNKEKRRVDLDQIIQLMQVDCTKQNKTSLAVPEKTVKNNLRKQKDSIEVTAEKQYEADLINDVENTVGSLLNNIDKSINVATKKDPVTRMNIVMKAQLDRQVDNSPLAADVQSGTISANSKDVQIMTNLKDDLGLKKQIELQNHYVDKTEKVKTRSVSRKAKIIKKVESDVTKLDAESRIAHLEKQVNKEQEEDGINLAKGTSTNDIEKIVTDVPVNVLPVIIDKHKGIDIALTNSHQQSMNDLASTDNETINQEQTLLNCSDMKSIENKSELKRIKKNKLSLKNPKNTDVAKDIVSTIGHVDKSIEEMSSENENNVTLVKENEPSDSIKLPVNVEINEDTACNADNISESIKVIESTHLPVEKIKETVVDIVDEEEKDPSIQKIQTSSINSEDSEPLPLTRIKILSKNRSKVTKALEDPEFQKYMELRQDALMDDHPELSQDEIIEYLFKTWDYEQNTKSDVAKTDDIEQSGLVQSESRKSKKTKRNKIKIRIVSPKNNSEQPTQLVLEEETTVPTQNNFGKQVDDIETETVDQNKTTAVELNESIIEKSPITPKQKLIETALSPIASEQKPIDTALLPIEDIEYGHLDFIFSTSPPKNTNNELDAHVKSIPKIQGLESIDKSELCDKPANVIPENKLKVNATLSRLKKRELRVSVEKMCFSNYSDRKIVNGPTEIETLTSKDIANFRDEKDTSRMSIDEDLDEKPLTNDSLHKTTHAVDKTTEIVCEDSNDSNTVIGDLVPNGALDKSDVSIVCHNTNEKQDCALLSREPWPNNEHPTVTSFSENGFNKHSETSSGYETVSLESVDKNDVKCNMLDSTVENNEICTNVGADKFIESVSRLPEPVKVNGFHVDECLDFSDGEFNAETSSINSEDSEPLSLTRIKILSKNRSKVTKALEDPEFQKYMELRQDALMDDHPELSQDEIIEYLFKTWDYEQNTKSDVAKTDDIEQSGLVKGLGQSLRQKTIRNSFKKRNKKRDEDTDSIKLDSSDTTVKRKLRTRVKSPVVSVNEDEVSLREDHILKIKKELDDRVSVNSDIIDVTGKNDESNSTKWPEVTPACELNSKNDTSSTSDKLDDHNDIQKSSKIKAETEEKRPKKTFVKEKSKSPKSSQNNTIKNYFKESNQPTQAAVSNLNGQSEFDSQKEIKQECDPETISISSEVSVTDLPLSKRKQRKHGEKQNNKTETDPEFLKYVELRQDILIDENPQLTQDEIVSYLYKTWLYEENAKSAIKKSDDIEQANLVKGLNQDTIQAPPKRVRKKIKLEDDSDVEDEVIPKNKPKRKVCPAFYNENLSDIEDEIDVFEIFKPKKKLNLLSPESKDIKTEVKSELAPKAQDVQPEVDSDVIDLDEYDEVEQYFTQLAEPKPNVFKGLVRERVCEICEKTGNLLKCKGCHCMFHDNCAKKAAEVVEIPAPASRGRKKKKKPGRKPKNFEDSESHSDDKSHDVSLELNASVEDDLEPRTFNEDDFEAVLTNKMKELIPEEVNYDSYSSDECLDWNASAPGKCEIVDIKIKPKIVTDYANFRCSDCQKFPTPVCFVCKQAVSKKGVDVRQKCQTAHCHKYYHLECLDHWPQTQFNGGEHSKTNKNINEHFETLMCPRHVCHTCVSDDPRGCKTRFSGDKLARCVRCPATYHSFTKCLPAGTQILTGSLIVCPRHYEHRPGKVPCHVNTGWCFICALGGSLICCEYCPTSFHAECLNISPPEGGYMCEDCETGRLPLYGEMVWVKLGHYRWWPGIILHPSEIPPNIMAVKHSPGEFVVRFFGQYDYYWVNRGRVFPFQEGDSGRVSGQKSKIDAAFTTAMEHAQRACAILKSAEPNEEESLDIASSLLPPRYVKLKVNKPCGSLCGKKIDIEESSLTQCECNPDEENPCGMYSHCLNRMLLTECGPICRAAERCSNRQFEKRLYPKMTPYRTPQRGWGLKALEDIKAGQFVIEYVGELIDEEEFRRRMNRMHEIRDENFYFLTLDKERMIDAGPKGNLARFMNHCCEPNCETQKWTVLGDVRVGLFALYDIPANSELTFNYNLECAGIEKKRCMCGARRCSGYIGAKPKQDEPQAKKNKLAGKRTYKKRKNAEQSPSTSQNKPKRPVGRPAKPRELTEIEKDLLIIKNATNGISSDSECSGRLSSIDSERHPKALKRKRVSFSTEDCKRTKIEGTADSRKEKPETSEVGS